MLLEQAEVVELVQIRVKCEVVVAVVGIHRQQPLFYPDRYSLSLVELLLVEHLPLEH
jgi:hypothetical protein